MDPDSVKGFLAPEEGEALHDRALSRGALGPFLEIGSYCGKSALYLGTAAKRAGQVLFTVDHHRGSEEMQPGWEHHDRETWDKSAGAMDSLPFLRDTLRRAALEDHVVALVGPSARIASLWRTPLSFLFIDGGHSRANAFSDYRGWTPHVMAGGLLAIHDVFENPADGGRPPFEIYERALASGLFRPAGGVRSLRFLERLGAHMVDEEA
ncbi:MAG: class I SAM-dependent methyltransferase [Alphaproteobacteria bacterium]|nr:class I SAM-dependent methyltransferase [Alphaproteobacteria bacterium]